MTARIAPLEPPYDAKLQNWLDAVMRGAPPLRLFTTLARDPRLFEKFSSGSLLDRGHLTLRQREIVIDRTTALCASEYEWGVHMSLFAQKARLYADAIHSLVHGSADDACWSDEERDLLRLCDALHRDCDVGDELWQALRKQFSEGAILELLLLAGFYRTVSYLTNALRLPLEDGAARFPDRGLPSTTTRAPKSCSADAGLNLSEEANAMVKVNVMYPYTEGARFDHAYYRNRHLPMMKARLGSACAYYTVEKGVAGRTPGSPPAFVAMCAFICNSVEDYEAAIQKHRTEILGDIANYTDITPVVQFSQVIVERSNP